MFELSWESFVGSFIEDREEEDWCERRFELE
jgi:hypothetical protein